MRLSLPDWLEPLPDASQQRALDAWAIQQLGIPGLDLMERAAAGLRDEVTRGLGPRDGIVVVCGGGNNGGDGLAVARLLRDQGRPVRVLLLAEPERFSGDALTNLQRLAGEPPQPFAPELLDGAAAIVDAILGTGFSGEPRQPQAGAIVAINRFAAANPGVRVVACDVPSGVDASSGEVHGEAVTATRTVTFNAAKPGLWIEPGKRHSGRVTVVDIGIPAAGQPLAAEAGLIRPDVLSVVPRRLAGSNKFTSGSVLICGGSVGLTGAPTLTAMAAARAGAGYVTVAVPEPVAHVLQVKLLEQMVLALPAAHDAALEVLLGRSERVGALVVGPGLGRAESSRALGREVALRAPVPVLIDADGLNALGQDLEKLADRSAATVLTPHSGELGRLLGKESSEVDLTRLASARVAAKRSQSIVLLKGDDTIVAHPDGRTAISPGGAPALATAGTGDVLSGVLGAYLAKGMDPFTAACAAVEAHRAAGALAGEAIGTDGVIAGDVVTLLPEVLRRHDNPDEEA